MRQVPQRGACLFFAPSWSSVIKKLVSQISNKNLSDLLSSNIINKNI
ncbi:hypothetical protein GCWU000246_00605 [Jonquetella anthropi E3_33 E1]|nr:hypothetical protein GCWU000246_00605 [Jonquetella anthropi E3_33 E1]